MERQTLFGELSLRFSSHPENVATEALLYLFERYTTAWLALRIYLQRTGIQLPEAAIFRSQVWAPELAQPDLVASDNEGDRVLIIEVKFWAGLTENQPVTYLEGLPSSKPALLMVLCPAQRADRLWDKLYGRCLKAATPVGDTVHLETGFKFSRVGMLHAMCLLTWPQILGVLMREAESINDQGFLSDVLQLQGLCYRMDSDAFTPLRPDDVSAEVGRRVQQFADLIDELVAELARSHGADTKGLTVGGSQSEYGRYFRFSNLGLFVFYSPRLWARYGETPFWLQVKEAAPQKWEAAPWIREALDRLPAGAFQRIPETERPSVIGLELPTGVEKDEVISSLVAQIKMVVAVCDRIQPNNQMQATQ